jgi:DNA polymerase-3 subunit alpha
VVESLIKCGAFDGTGESRRGMLEALDGLLKKSKSKDHGQLSLFGSPPKRETPEWPINQKLSFEREALGFYISGHPLEKFKPELKKLGVITTDDIKTSSSSVRIAGVITQLKLKNTKKGDRYASFILEDWLGAIEALVWPDVYRSVANILVADEPVIVSARSEVTEERRNLIVETIESLISIRDRTARYGLLNLSIDDDLESHRDTLVGILEKHKGNCPLKVRIEVEGRFVSLVLKDKRDAPISVSPSETLCEEVELLFGRPVLSFV